MRWITGAVIAATVAWSGAAEAATERRVALVIGNSAYEHAPALANPRNDAEAIALAFERLDFEVVKGFDLDNNEMRETIHTFARSLSRADVAAFYYAGHGIQIDGRNFLIPVDAKLQHESDLAFNAVDAKLVIDQMMRESKVKLIMLDACRDNPLAQTLASSVAPSRSAAIGRGLAKIENVQGTLIAFATEPGNVAYDGDGLHSPFTEALLEHIETPEAEINLVMTRVRGEVYRSTRERQLPWVNVSLTDEFYLNGAPRSLVATDATIPAEAVAGASQPAAETPEPVQVAKVEPRATADDAAPTTGRTMQSWEIEKALWDAVDSGGSLAEYQAYLDEYPDGRFAGVARARIAQLSATETIKTATADSDKRGQTATTANVAPLKLTPAATTAAAETDTGIELANVTAEPAVEPVDPEAAEAGLRLSRNDQRMVQQRLKLIGHDPRGVDGIFGPNTRAAISEWQSANDLRASGYLDEEQHATLLEESEGAYKEWAAAVERERRQREAAAREEAKRQAAAAEASRKQQATRSAKAATAPKKTTAKKKTVASPPPAQVQAEAPVQQKQVRTIQQADRVYIQEVPGEVIIRRRQQRTGHAIGTAAGIAAGIAIMGGFGR